ncbi:MAG: histidinol dehydrogenase [Lachnospiraceae bacterium]|nr:histidinol dehydrogenase [Lachnospiraceae bacterium]
MIKILKYGEISNRELFSRNDALENVAGTVAEIIETVRTGRDAAILKYNEKFDGVKLESLRVTEAELEEAMSLVEPEFLEVLERSAANIRAFHKCQLRNGFVLNEQDGVVIGQKILPIEKVGVYVPGGSAPLSSTVLMDVIPAKIAGCREIVMVSSPNREGKINPYILAAAKTAGVDCIFKVGGAQAIAALAFGTESIPKVDKIVGPGSAFVAEAKKQLFGKVSIDMIAGPSEILAVADGGTDPRFMAADMLSQAEHDKNASAVLITDSMELAEAVRDEIERQLPQLERYEIARASIDDNGKIVVADDLLTAIDIANEIAPEHFELCVENPFDYLDKIRNAGSVFLGRNCPEAVGDYYAGANHTLPTSGTARFFSPLSVDDFVKKMQYMYYSADALDRAAGDIALFARKEGLTGHAKSAMIRTENRKAPR